jgi:hypothetical protein
MQYTYVGYPRASGAGSELARVAISLSNWLTKGMSSSFLPAAVTSNACTNGGAGLQVAIAEGAIAGRNTARRGAFCYSGGATTLAVSAPAFWRSLRLPNSPERMMLGCIRKLLSFKLPM